MHSQLIFVTFFSLVSPSVGLQTTSKSQLNTVEGTVDDGKPPGPFFYLITSNGDVPVRCGMKGKMECASRDGANCLWSEFTSDGYQQWMEMRNFAYTSTVSTSCPGWEPVGDGPTACDALGCNDQWYYSDVDQGVPLHCAGDDKVACASNDGQNCMFSRYAGYWSNFQEMSGVVSKTFKELPCEGRFDAFCKNFDCYAPTPSPTPAPPTPAPPTPVVTAATPCEGETCTIMEDPHIEVFDGTQVSLLEGTMPLADEAGIKWLVKSNQVSIQAQYVASEEAPDPNFFVEAVAVGGEFLKGNTLIVGSLEDRITWNGQPILEDVTSEFRFQDETILVKARRGGNSSLVGNLTEQSFGVNVELPANVDLVINRLPKHVNMAITMKPQDGGQDGLCGNFNGVSGDDTSEFVSERFETDVDPSDSLF